MHQILSLNRAGVLRVALKWDVYRDGCCRYEMRPGPKNTPYCECAGTLHPQLYRLGLGDALFVKHGRAKRVPLDELSDRLFCGQFQ